MKRLILLVFSIFLSYSIAIAQDGINYQGAATDGNGDELTNQNITLRASVLSVSASGNLEWEETHSATTDQFGLFNVVIGQGTNTTNGATTNFDDMDWGSGNHFLKIEMDATGGTNYAMIGTTQMMSVPYALYAKSAGIDYDSISNLLSNDSTFITNVGGSGGVLGSDWTFPEGLYGEGVIWDFNISGDYTVPVGKNLYITHYFTPGYGELAIDGITVRDGETNNHSSNLAVSNSILTLPIIAGAGQIVSEIGGPGTDNKFSGLLVNATSLQPLTHCISSTCLDGSLGSTYIVPSGMKLFINSYYNKDYAGELYVDNILIKRGETNTDVVTGFHTPIIVNSNQAISSGSSGDGTVINGYLADENYFAGGGGGGGSSGNSNSNTSGPNQTAGIGSITDLNDFDKEYDMFNAQFSGGFDNNSYYPIDIHTDQLKNIYIIGQYNPGDNCSIGGISLFSGSGSTFFIAKYDSTGVIISVISEPVSNSGNADSYSLESSIVDNYGNIFVGGRMKHSSGPYFAFIRKYSTANLTFVDEEISSTNAAGTSPSNRLYDIVSDGSGGVYLAGVYQDDMTIGGIYLSPDQGDNDQGFVFHWNSSGNVPWANSIGDINESNLDDFASSIIVDKNNDILVAGILKLYNGTQQMSKYFIKRYNTGGILMTTVESPELNNTWYSSWGIKINTDNNGNIYLFTASDHDNFAFNSFTLDKIIAGASHILYKMDINFSVLDAINFGTGERYADQIITLSNNDVILRSRDKTQYIIDNNIYLQDVNQYGNITHLDSNNSFVKFHTIGNNIGTQDAISITSDANTIYCLYKRTGTFINNGTNHPTGCYVTKEKY
jgi:hypothetical protein